MKQQDSAAYRSEEPVFAAVKDSIAPVIYMFALHIVRRAQALNIKRLYFFSRDGYSVMRAAEEICRKENISLEMTYFYCSRYSLRMAAYRFKDSCAYEKLFCESYRMSPKNILMRAGLDENERLTVYKDLNLEASVEDELMDRSRANDFCGRLRGSECFERILTQKSDRAYAAAEEYFRQCGMDEYDHIGVVDLGWTGSMQYTLKRLLESCKINCRITGFYLGLLEEPVNYPDSIYEPWLFEGGKNSFIKAWFSQNLLECICTAPHGMTTGYEKTETGITPVFAENENDPELIRRLSDIMAEYARQASGFEYNVKRNRKAAIRKLKGLMFTPCKETAESFAAFGFCDDISECYHGSLCGEMTAKQFSDCFFRRKGTVRPYWFYGALARSGLFPKMLYRYLYYFSEAARYFIVTNKKRVNNNG